MGTVEEQAVQELIQNIVQRGDGKVWMDDWRPRFASLGGTPKDFMEQRPDLFQLNFHGRGFSVELVGAGEEMAKDMGAESGSFKGGKGGGKESAGPVRGGPMGGIVLADPCKGGGKMGGGMFKGGPKGGIILAAPKGQAYGGGDDFFGDSYGPPKGGGKFGGGKFGGGKFDSYGPPKGGKKGKGYAALPGLPNPEACGDMADMAIQEIKEQMAARGEPKVWIEDWRQRYGPLGPSPKQFLEARPDVFNLHYSSSGKGYSVYLVEEDGGMEAAPAPQQPFRPAAYGAAAAQAPDMPIGGELDTPSNNKEDEQSCVDEITRLVKASPDGRICILNWFRRFAHLAKSPRAFMESRPDKFTLSFTGNTYSVSLAAPGSGLAAPKAQPAKRQPPMMITARPRPAKIARADPNAAAIGAASHNANPRHWSGPPAAGGGPAQPRGPPAAISPADSALDYLGDKEEDALAEIFDQLSKPNNNGKINFPNWMGRFGHLATNPRAFIEAHPDKFEVVPGPGLNFTVELC